jgi:putative aldouronate transport system substrate-binding protein
MLKKSRKWLGVLLVFIFIVSLFAGCTKKTDSTVNDQGDQDTATATTAPGGNTGGDTDQASEPVEVSIYVPSRLADKIYTTDTMTFKALAQRCNMKFDMESVFSRQAGERFDVIISTGQLPDIMAGDKRDINTYGMSGAFIPLNDLIDQYAPNIKKYLVENKEALAQTVAPDGNIYAIPMLSAVRTAMGYNIRQDWLDKLGLERPVTIDDWYNVLTAFKKNDLNGNGAGDVTPLVLDRMWEAYYMNFADAWGIELNEWVDYWMIRDGKMVFAPIQPETKEFLATMAKWYQEGLIDPEFVTREDTNNYHIFNNKGGATCYWTGYVAGMNTNSEVLANDPNTNWQVIPPPVLTEGQSPKTFSQQAPIVNIASWAISSSSKHAVDIIKMFDYVYSDEGSMLFNFGIEGESYQMANGVPDYTDPVKNAEGGMVNWIRGNGLQALIGMRQMPEYEKASCATDDVRRQLFDYVENDYFFPINPELTFTTEEKDIYDVKMSSIKTYAQEELLKFFIGSRPIDEFDSFVNRINELGISEMEGIVNQAYDRYKKIAE